jgi:hypothetical protein
MYIIKALGPEINLNSNSTVSNASLVRIINSNTTTTTTVVHIGNGNNSNTEYANLTVIANAHPTILQKGTTDIIWATANGVLAVPIAFKN